MRTYKVGQTLAKVRRPGKLQQTEFLESGLYPVIDQGNSVIAGYTNREELVIREPLPITIFGDHTRRVKLATEPFVCGADGTQLLFPNCAELDPTFYFYAISNIDLSNYFYARHFKFLKEMSFLAPRIEEQRKVVAVLRGYDDLIANNARRVELLQQSARLLFNEWFVNLRYPGHEHDKVVDGMPKDWERKKVGALLAKVPSTKKIKKEDFLKSGETPCIDQSREFIGGYTDDPDARIKSPLPMIVFGDHTRILKFVNFPFARGADGTQLLFPSDLRISSEFFYFLLDAIDLSNYFYARHFKFLKAQEVWIPREHLMNEFTAFAKDVMKEVSVLFEYSRKLGNARDLLLPRLMDGRLSV